MQQTTQHIEGIQMTVTFNNRQYQITNIEAIGGELAKDLIKRGWEAAFYTLTGKRGSTKICFKSIKSGDFFEAY